MCLRHVSDQCLTYPLDTFDRFAQVLLEKTNGIVELNDRRLAVAAKNSKKFNLSSDFTGKPTRPNIRRTLKIVFYTFTE